MHVSRFARLLLPLILWLALAGAAGADDNGAIVLRLPDSSSSGKTAAPSVQQSHPPTAAGSWTTLCASVARTAQPDCSTDQRVVLRGTANLFVMVRVTVPSQTRRPTIFVQTPIGILLRPGVILQLDGKGPAKLELQVCDQSGCYAGTPMSGDFLGAMLAAKTLTVKIQGVNNRVISVPFALTGFKQAFDKIK